MTDPKTPAQRKTEAREAIETAEVSLEAAIDSYANAEAAAPALNRAESYPRKTWRYQVQHHFESRIGEGQAGVDSQAPHREGGDMISIPRPVRKAVKLVSDSTAEVGVCSACHEGFTVRAGNDPTAVCDPCAQELLVILSEFVRTLIYRRPIP